MILKIDHIAFCSPRFDEDVRQFESLGYRTEFKEKGLRDLDNKRGFMQNFTGQLDMALLLRPGSIGIELLNHGHVVESPSRLLPVLEGMSADGARTGDTLRVIGTVFEKVKSGTWEFFIQEGADMQEIRCDKVVAETDDIPSAVRFWSGLGFKSMAADKEGAFLEFPPFLGSATVRMYLRKSERPASQCWLDSEGFNCLAFFSSDAQKDRQRFGELGMGPTEMNRFRVNGKDLCIYWLRGPGGEVAEVIGFASSRP
jgi:hypothetical protein